MLSALNSSGCTLTSASPTATTPLLAAVDATTGEREEEEGEGEEEEVEEEAEAEEEEEVVMRANATPGPTGVLAFGGTPLDS